jgi:hypothetical protein
MRRILEVAIAAPRFRLTKPTATTIPLLSDLDFGRAGAT